MTGSADLFGQPGVRATALLLIDLLCGVAAGDLAPHKPADVVARADRAARAVRAAGGLVVLVKVDPGPAGLLFPQPPADVTVPVPSSLPADHYEIVPELAGNRADVIVTKHQWGPFYGTDLDVQLRRRGITTLLVGGIATNLGVESAAREAHDRGYAQVFLEDAMTAYDGQAHHGTVQRLFPLIGRVRTTEQAVRALESAS